MGNTTKKILNKKRYASKTFLDIMCQKVWTLCFSKSLDIMGCFGQKYDEKLDNMR
jgi:hypothetical protein